MTTKATTINEAKRLLMDRYGIDEPKAHKFINRTAMDLGISMLEVSRRIIAELNSL